MGLLNKLSISRSIPEDKVIHGIKVAKVPMSRYITAMSELEDLPKELINACFPDMTGAEILQKLQTIKSDDLTTILLNFLTRAPEIFIRTVATLGGFEEEALLNLTPSELLECWRRGGSLTTCRFSKRIPKAAQILTRIRSMASALDNNRIVWGSQKRTDE